jgi:hypothetical protein
LQLNNQDKSNYFIVWKNQFSILIYNWIPSSISFININSSAEVWPQGFWGPNFKDLTQNRLIRKGRRAIRGSSQCNSGCNPCATGVDDAFKCIERGWFQQSNVFLRYLKFPDCCSNHSLDIDNQMTFCRNYIVLFSGCTCVTVILQDLKPPIFFRIDSC